MEASNDEVLRMEPDELDLFLNGELMAFFAEHGMGTHDRHCSVNKLDAANVKEAIRARGLRFKCADGEPGLKFWNCEKEVTVDGFLASFYRIAPPHEWYTVFEATEELAVARAAAIAIVESRIWERGGVPD